MKSAQKRREEELQELMKEGMAVRRLSRWHFRIGTLHVWPAVGRWEDEESGHRGRLHNTSVRQILDEAIPPLRAPGSDMLIEQ